MTFTVDAYKIKNRRNSVVGTATLNITGTEAGKDIVLVCKGIQIIENKDGDLFLGFPTKKKYESDKEYTNIFFPANADTRKLITDLVIKAYKELP